MGEVIAAQQRRHFADYSRTANDPKYRKIWAMLLNRDPAQILDVGCTNGALLAPFVARGWQASGMELCEAPAREAEALGVNVRVGDASEGLPFESNRFDVVVAGEIVEHMIDDVGFLTELRRVLKPGGILIITTPNLVSLSNRFIMGMGFMPRFAYADFHYRIYNRRVLSEKFSQAGLSIQNVVGSYVMVSRTFNPGLGRFGEWLGHVFPTLSEHLIVVSTK